MSQDPGFLEIKPILDVRRNVMRLFSSHSPMDYADRHLFSRIDLGVNCAFVILSKYATDVEDQYKDIVCV